MSGQPERAFEIFQSVPQELFSDASNSNRQALYQVVMIAWARAGHYAKCRELFIEMTACGIQPDKHHYNALLTACAKEPNAELAQSVFDQMRSLSLVPGVQEWTILISCHRNDLPRAKAVFDEMVLTGCKPSSLTYQELLKAHVQA